MQRFAGKQRIRMLRYSVTLGTEMAATFAHFSDAVVIVRRYLDDAKLDHAVVTLHDRTKRTILWSGIVGSSVNDSIPQQPM